MPHAGIDISDDAISFIEYSRPVGNRTITKYGRYPLPVGIIEGGDIKDEEKLVTILSDMVHTHGLHYAKMSIPEEKAYLFETDIPYGDFKLISQNIEFKLEENIPIAAADTIFSFDLLPVANDRSKLWRASVSAVPRSYIERMMGIFNKAGLATVAFETAPRAIARVVAYLGSVDAIILHVMDHKTGVYIVSGQAVGFTSTITAGSVESDMPTYIKIVSAEIRRVYSYWLNKEGGTISTIKRAIVVGKGAEDIAVLLRETVSDTVTVEPVDIWKATLAMSAYVPPIARSDSYEYATASGLAL